MFKITFDKDRSFRKELSRLSDGLSAWAQPPILGALYGFIAAQDHHRGLFDSGGAGGTSGPWATLRLSTLKSRARRVRCSRIYPRDYAGPMGGDRTLFWSGRLRSSLTGESLPGMNAADMVRRVRPRSFTFGTATPTAVFHRNGRGGRNPMPSRNPFSDVVGADVAMSAVEARIMAFLRDELSAPKFGSMSSGGIPGSEY